MQSYGGNTNIGLMKSVLVKHLRQAWRTPDQLDGQWQALCYPSRPDYKKALDDYEVFLNLLKQTGSEIHFLPENPATGLDSLYTYDPLFVFDGGAVLLNMGKDLRRGEPEAAGQMMAELGIPIAGRITGSAHVEGGDFCWLDSRTIAIGQGYRTNLEGINQLRRILGDAVDEVIPVPLPHWTGPDDCLHLLSMISPLDKDLAVVYSRMMPVPFRQLLLDKGYSLVEVPDEEYDTMACNVLAFAPRKCIMIDCNPLTRARLEKAGCEVWVYPGSEISHKGGGGPTCMTRPLRREI
jgi:arginine deiminase